MEAATAEKLCEWLQEYQAYPVLATLSDGEDTIIAALKKTWPEAPHQRCQEHFLANLTEAVMDYDTQLRQAMRQNLGGLPKAPKEAKDSPFSQPNQSGHETRN